ncbi:MAG: threonine/homoserine/homoserine lactone efflux protein [Lentimonas sp.]|jgi:threonine/homoserine/homoserine lactone efflux protein
MDFFAPILTGLILGLGTLLFIGPVLFYLIDVSIQQSKKAGYMVAFGIIAGDLIYVLLVRNGFSEIFNLPETRKYMALGGAIILLFLGVKSLIKSSKKLVKAPKSNSKSLTSFFINGFLINFINPFVIVVWIGFVALNKEKLESEASVNLSLVTTLVFILFTDVLKVYFAVRFNKLFTAYRLRIMNLVFGVLLIVFSIRLFIHYFNL